MPGPTHSLEPFIGQWSMEAEFPALPPSDVRGKTMFEWLAGGPFLLQRWAVPIPEAPDGIAVVAWSQARDRYLQHYFDSRGVARVYEMSFDGTLWHLSRTAADLSPLDFAQRFTGTFSPDAQTITGSWETGEVDGSCWKHDFTLTYRRLA